MLINTNIETIIEAQPALNSDESLKIVMPKANNINIKVNNEIIDVAYINALGLLRITVDRKNSSFLLEEYEETPLYFLVIFK